MKNFFEIINRKANLINALAISLSIIGIAISLNFKITIYALVGIVIALIVGIIFFSDFDSDFYDTKRQRIVSIVLKSLLFLSITAGLLFGFISLVENFGIVVSFLKSHWIVISVSVVGFVIIIKIFSFRSYKRCASPSANYDMGGNRSRSGSIVSNIEDRTIINRTELDEVFKEYIKKLERTFEKNTAPEDIIAHMLKDTKETTEYFKISKNDTKKSFYISIVFSILGFSLIVFAVVWGIISQNITPTIISSIGGVVTNVIAGTAFFIRKQSLVQLNHYFDKLSRNQDILVSVKMVERMSKNRRDEMYQEIIKNVLNNVAKLEQME